MPSFNIYSLEEFIDEIYKEKDLGFKQKVISKMESSRKKLEDDLLAFEDEGVTWNTYKKTLTERYKRFLNV